MNTLNILANRLADAEQQTRLLPEDRYAAGCADTYRELAMLLRDEVARYQEQHE